MGTFRQRIEVAAGKEGPFVALDALVDTGATYTVLPRRLVVDLGIEPSEQMRFLLADGRKVTRDLAQLIVRLDDRLRSTPCVLDDEAPEALLGAVTMEEFGLAPDPIARRLVPTIGYIL